MNRSILTCICTGVALASLSTAQARDGRGLNILVRTPDGSSSEGAVVSFLNARGEMALATAAQGGYAAQDVGSKLVLQVRHPTFGVATVYGTLEPRDSWVGVSFVGPNQARLLTPGDGKKSTAATPGGAALGPGTCGAGAGDCCVADGTPGCDDVDCCTSVCTLDPFCCNTSWDSICVSEAQADPLCDQGACGGGGGNPNCNPNAGDCCVADGTPGCNDPDCCAAVCAADPFCCDVAWDSICADEAVQLCGDLCGGGGGCCGQPGTGSCCVADGTPCCDDADCCNIVCTADPFCCDVGWDSICAGEAVTMCGDLCAPQECDPPLACPPGSLLEPEPCGADTNGGCNAVPPAFTGAACGETWCGTAWAAGGTRDTDWYLVCHGGGTLSATLVSEAQNLAFIVDGIGTCAPVVVGTIGCSANCANQVVASADLPAGQYVVFVGAGNCDGSGIFDGNPCGSTNDYYVSIACTPPANPCVGDDDCPPGFVCQNGCCAAPPPELCPGAGGDCCVADGTPGCDNVDCCNRVCAIDPFCCDVAWDSICADEAATFPQCGCGGGGNCPGAGGDCCTADGTPGCDDVDCCEAVCGVDPFCCDTAWDSICSGEACDLFAGVCDCCGGGGSNCCEPNGGLGCDDAECEAIVCGVDPFCCDVAWDSICAGEAADLCGDLCGGGGNPACAPGAGDCCVADGTPGCDDLDCCNAICAADPFCCDVSWDSICASAAQANPLCDQGACAGGNCCGDPGAGSCCVADGTPCCDDLDCCNIVCGVDPFCCDVGWDSICAGEAADLCGDLCAGACGPGVPFACGPGAGDCFIADGTPGCDDCSCCALVCGLDPFCCDVGWDEICAGEAASFCGEACTLECPPGADIEPEPCGADTNGGCNSIPPAFTNAACGDTWCGTTWAAGGTRDTDWYLVNHPGGPLIGTLTSEIPAICFIVDGIGTCSPVVVGTIGCSNACTNNGVASADLAAGQYVVFVAPGTDCGGGGLFDGFPCGGDFGNDYYVTISCPGPCQGDDDCPPGQICQDGVCIFPPPSNDLCTDATSLPLPSGGSTCIAGTNINALNEGSPACPGGLPQVGPGVWYSFVGNGNTVTVSTCPGGGGGSNCCVPNGGLGCDDAECQAAVCGIDPFCCDVAWDGICAAEAADLCGDLCAGGGGGCGGADFDTMLTVFCGDCPEPAASNCCIPNGGLGCDDAECEAAVCAVDPFCCDVAWDGICAGEAVDLCGDLCTGGGGSLCIAGNDDFCGLQSQVQFCAKNGSKYLVLVHGFGGSVGNFELTVTDNGAACVPAVDCPLSCFEIISESTECIGGTGNFNYHVVGINTCTNSPITFDFVAQGGHVGQQMCFKISLFDNNGDLCCNATVCTTVPDCLPNSQPCDLDGDQMIGVTDMLLLLAAWNSNPGGPPDYDGDGTVAVTDFLHLLSNWGPCQ